MKLLFVLVQERLDYRIAEIEALLQLEGCPVEIGPYDPQVRLTFSLSLSGSYARCSILM